ncbi:MAG: MBL fold metallo-hydrolase [Planctomycetaceae bacterium]
MAEGIEISSGEFVAAVEGGDEIHVLDVRAPHRLAGGRIDIVPDGRFHNIKGSEIMALADPGSSGLDPTKPLTVVCGVGSDSRKVAERLSGRGFRARSLRGGMSAWMLAVVPREQPAPAPLTRFVQFDRIGKGALGYLLVSGDEAIVVDPPRDPSAYVAAAREAGARIVVVADTHAHADYISGGPALAGAMGVPYYLHPADAVYPYDGTAGKISFEPLREGQRIRFGKAELEVLHTPGHTEGSVTYRLGNKLALTGDFLFVGSVGRPDLGGKTEEWSVVLWASIERARRSWPRELTVFPAHYASDAERRPDRSVGALFSWILARNGPVGLPGEPEFRAWVRSRAGSFPEAYRRIKAINVGLEQASPAECDELEGGRNECALK